MSAKYIMSLDQGTTGSTCLIFDENLNIVARAYNEVKCMFPHPGWVSQDPVELWETSLTTMRQALQAGSLEGKDIAAIGITNQRETTILWDRTTGKPVHEAIVWQCRRTAPLVEKYASKGIGPVVAKHTGLLLDAYFSASKIAWILQGSTFVRQMADEGTLAFGTVDTWMLWNLTGGKVHATEPSNAARTMLYNINDMCWDEELLGYFNIPAKLLPEVKPSVSLFGTTAKELFGAEIPIWGIAGDQQAALFGQSCFAPGDAKNTYGTGCFLMMNVGHTPVHSKNKLLTTVAWQIGDEVDYALEGSIFSAGSAVQWLRDGLGLIKQAAETEPLALSLPDNGGVYFVPAFSGLGAPYWDPYALGATYGITRDTRPAHLARAVLEASAYQTRDVLEAMKADSSIDMHSLRVDGGMVANQFLMQFQADLLNIPVECPKVCESTAKGAASLAGIGVGMFDKARLSELQVIERVYNPAISEELRERYYTGWKRAVARTLTHNDVDD